MGYCNDGKYETTVINNQLKPPNMCTDDWSRSIEQAKATNPSSLSSFRWQMRSHMAFVWIIWYHLACKYVFVCVCMCVWFDVICHSCSFVCLWLKGNGIVQNFLYWARVILDLKPFGQHKMVYDGHYDISGLARLDDTVLLL